ncbi:MAG TPA: hypothetical protein PKN48_00980 [Bacteroidales bacterium]|nr:hypothetical protein [Bacteroidales bacterium]
MSVQKEILTAAITADLSQYDLVTEDGLSIPTEFSYNGLIVTVPEGYYDDVAKRGNIRSVNLRYDVIDAAITPEEDAGQTLVFDQVRAVENQRLATVLSDRILGHIVEYLETDAAANNIELARKQTQSIVDDVVKITENIEDLAIFANSQSVSYNQLLTILQTTFAAVLGGAAAIPLLANLQATYAAPNIITSATQIQADMIELKTKLEEIKKTLDTITRDNSIAVI